MKRIFTVFVLGILVILTTLFIKFNHNSLEESLNKKYDNEKQVATNDKKENKKENDKDGRINGHTNSSDSIPVSDSSNINSVDGSSNKQITQSEEKSKQEDSPVETSEVVSIEKVANQEVKQAAIKPIPTATEEPVKYTQPVKRTLTVSASYYIAMCAEGCTGITATGIDVRNTNMVDGYRIIAADPSVIPLGTIVRVVTPQETFMAKVADTGGGIRGNMIDILINDLSHADPAGRVTATVEIM